MFKKAIKYERRLRMAISGPSGSGKTYTALTIAKGLAGADGKIALVDTEGGSAGIYADIFDFDSAIDTIHDPRGLGKMIAEAEKNYSVLIIDSFSHYYTWLLDFVNAQSTKGGDTAGFYGWKKASPIQDALVNAILNAKIHIIATLRSKTEYSVGRDEQGRTTITKIGTEPIQRKGVEFEFDIFATMDLEHNLSIEKSRFSGVDQKSYSLPGVEIAEHILAELKGEPMPTPDPTPTPSTPIQNKLNRPGAIEKILKMAAELGDETIGADTLTAKTDGELVELGKSLKMQLDTINSVMEDGAKNAGL